MRTYSSILLFLPLLDVALLVPLERILGPSLWLVLLASALFGLVLLKMARRGVERSDRGMFDSSHLSTMIANQRTVMSGILLVWPGIFSDLAAIMLLLTAPTPLRVGATDHPLHWRQTR